MAENPYSSPLESDSSAEGPEKDALQADDASQPSSEWIQAPFPYFAPIVQFSLRLLGVYLVVIGVASLVEDAISITINWRTHTAIPSYEFLGRFFGSCVYFGAGLYLMLGGNWLIERVFLPLDWVNRAESNNRRSAT